MPIRITSKRAGFRRCGMPHPAEPTVYPDGRWTEEEMERLRAEPMLVVEVVPEGDGPEVPAGPTDGEILAAVKEVVERGDEGDLTKDGRPKVSAVEAVLGRDISTEERDRAYERLTEPESD